MATIEIECSNTHSIPVFSDFLNEVQKRFYIEKEAKSELYSFIIQMGLYDFYTIIQKGSLSTTFEDCLLFINFKAKKHG